VFCMHVEFRTMSVDTTDFVVGVDSRHLRVGFGDHADDCNSLFDNYFTVCCFTNVLTTLMQCA